jgi:hypothetical protein
MGLGFLTMVLFHVDIRSLNNFLKNLLIDVSKLVYVQAADACFVLPELL